MNQRRFLFLAAVVLLSFCGETKQQAGNRNRKRQESFQAELFLNNDDLNAGLYEGEVKGRRRFGDSQVPHGEGTIYYFTTDKYNRVNYTGSWVDGEREGNGTTSFKDGAVYQGGYKQGLENGPGFIRYQNGNTLDAEFVAGKIQGHGVFRYSNGDQREGFFKDNILDGQVIFTRRDGVTLIEQWLDGKQIQQEGEELLQLVGAGVAGPRESGDTALIRNEIEQDEIKSKDPAIVSLAARGGGRSVDWKREGGNEDQTEDQDLEREEEVARLGELARSRARSFLFDIFTGVN